MKTLREIMTDSIKNDGAWSFNFNRSFYKGLPPKILFKTYLEWLNSLGNKDFLDEYNNVCKIVNALD
jgi:hypothetical protein